MNSIVRMASVLALSIVVQSCTTARELPATVNYATASEPLSVATCLVSALDERQKPSSFIDRAITHHIITISPGTSFEVRPIQDLHPGLEAYFFHIEKAGAATNISGYAVSMPYEAAIRVAAAECGNS